MQIFHWMDLESPGHTPSRVFKKIFESNWSTFGTHERYDVKKKLAENDSKNPIDPSLGYKFGGSMNLQSAIAMYLPQPEVYAFIRKEGDQHCVKSHSGKNLGCYQSASGARKRLKQVEYFKHVKAFGDVKGLDPL